LRVDYRFGAATYAIELVRPGLLRAQGAMVTLDVRAVDDRQPRARGGHRDAGHPPLGRAASGAQQRAEQRQDERQGAH
jgi:hypothetical protein